MPEIVKGIKLTETAERELKLLPGNLQGGLRRYFEDRIETGGFLRAVLENDLHGAIRKADASSELALPQLVRWLYNHAPFCGHGSKLAVHDWLKGGK